MVRNGVSINLITITRQFQSTIQEADMMTNLPLLRISISISLTEERDVVPF